MDLFDTATTLPFDVPKEEGYSVVSLEAPGSYRITVPRGELLYVEHFFSKKVSDRTVEYFQENDSLNWKETSWECVTAEELENIGFTNIRWKQDYIKLYGKRIPLPRLTSWYGDSGASYTYSGIKSAPNEWNAGLTYLKQEIQRYSGCTFNSVLLNWYRNGEDHLNWHADDEKELGVNPTIASANFGETREFLLRSNEDKSRRLILPLKHGTLLIMQGEMQKYWQHSVPKRKRVAGSRFNLTFRHIHVS